MLAPLLMCAPAAHAWLFALPSDQPTAARALGFASDGTVVAAGDFDVGTHRVYAVFRIDPANGAGIGAYVHDSSRGGRAHALVMDGDDAIAAGEASTSADASAFLVTRSTPIGVESWTASFHGTGDCGEDVAYAVTLTDDGDVFAAGQLSNFVVETNVPAFAVINLDAANGDLGWQVEYPEGVARAVVADDVDAIAAGTIAGQFSVVKLSGDDGTEIWRADVGAGEVSAIVLGGGAVYAAGRLGGSFAVVKLNASTGAEIWTTASGDLPGPGFARAIVRLANGDVVAAGERDGNDEPLFTTIRLTNATGGVVWEDSDPSVVQPAVAHGVARDANDGVVSVGTAAWNPGGPASFSVRAVHGADGALRWGTGILSDHAETRALTVVTDANDDVVIAGQLGFFGFPPSFTVQKLHGADGVDFPRCGNGTLEDGEQCDDDNTADGDCCSSTCQYEGLGSACEDDDEECTTDECDGAGLCVHAAIGDGTLCDDDNACTSNEMCVATSCQDGDFAPPGFPCDADDNGCTDDACNGDGGCIPTPNTDPCDDFNACTTGDTCTAGVCFGAPQTATPCDDFNPCTTPDACQSGVCMGAPAPGAPCTDDGNPCTDDECSGFGFCAHPPNSAPCDDNDSCTLADLCVSGECNGTSGSTTSTTGSTTPTTTSTTTTAAPMTTTTSTTTTTAIATTTSSTTTTVIATTSTTTSTVVATTTSTTTSTAAGSTSTSSTVTTTSSTAPVPSSSTSTTAVVTTSTSTTAAPTTTTLPGSCATHADCDDGDPCNGGETCVGGECLAARGVSPRCEPADPLAVVTKFDDDTVALCNTRTRAVETTIGVGRAPWGVAWTADGARVLVTNRESRSVSVLDTATRTALGTLEVGPQPLGIATHPFLPRAYVASYDADRVDVIDTATLGVVGAIRVGNGPAGLAVHPAGTFLYVANYIGNTVSVVDLSTNDVVATIKTPKLPVGVAVNSQGTKVYVPCFKGRSLAVLGTVSNSLVATIDVGRRPIGVAFDAAGARAYVTDSRKDTVVVIDAASDLPIDEVSAGRYPIGVDVADDGSVWVAGSRGDVLTVLGTQAATVPVAGRPVAVGRFIGTPADDCPAVPLPCDDGSPYTTDSCEAGFGCRRAAVSGAPALRAGVDAMAAIVAEGAGDPLAGAVGADLPALESALAALEAGQPDALRTVGRALKPILKTLERARRKQALGPHGARLLDLAREAKRQVKALARGGGA